MTEIASLIELADKTFSIALLLFGVWFLNKQNQKLTNQLHKEHVEDRERVRARLKDCEEDRQRLHAENSANAREISILRDEVNVLKKQQPH